MSNKLLNSTASKVFFADSQVGLFQLGLDVFNLGADVDNLPLHELDRLHHIGYLSHDRSKLALNVR